MVQLQKTYTEWIHKVWKRPFDSRDVEEIWEAFSDYVEKKHGDKYNLKNLNINDCFRILVWLNDFEWYKIEENNLNLLSHSVDTSRKDMDAKTYDVKTNEVMTLLKSENFSFNKLFELGQKWGFSLKKKEWGWITDGISNFIEIKFEISGIENGKYKITNATAVFPALN